MNNPSTPPQSANKEEKGKAGFSLMYSTVFVENTGTNVVIGSTPVIVYGSSVNLKM